MTRRLASSIRKYSARNVAITRPGGSGGRPAPETTRRSRLRRRNGFGAKRRGGTPVRVTRRPDPAAWSEDELIGLHEAVALMFPLGPLTVSSLRTAIAKGRLGHARIAGKIYTTRAALAAMAACRPIAAADRGVRLSDADWDAHLATLLPKRGGRAG